MKPLHLTYQIVKVENGADKIICEYPLPALEGFLPADSCVGCRIPTWDCKDKDGKLVSPGKYAVNLIVPENFEFSYVGTSNINTFPTDKDLIGGRIEFDIVP